MQPVGLIHGDDSLHKIFYLMLLRETKEVTIAKLLTQTNPLVQVTQAWIICRLSLDEPQYGVTWAVSQNRLASGPQYVRNRQYVAQQGKGG